METAELQLEVDQLNIDFPHALAENFVDPQGIVRHDLDLLRRGQPHGGNVGQVHQRVFQFRILQAVLHHGVFQLGPVRITDALGQTARHDIAYLHGHRDDLHPLHQRAAVVDAADKMIGHPLIL